MKIYIKENELKAMINKVISNLFKHKDELSYEVINESNSWASAMKKGAMGANGLRIEYSVEKTLYSPLNEAIDFEPGENEKGGIIVFSTEVNALSQSNNRFINWLKQKMMTLSNKINATRKIDKIANENNLVGWTIGKYLDGRYKAKNGKTYGKDSLSVMVVGVTFDTLIKIAESLCKSFTQESVLVKDFSSGRILFVNPD